MRLKRVKFKIFIVVILLVLIGTKIRRDYVANINLPEPVNRVTSSYHLNGHQDAWTQYVREDRVQVQTVKTKTTILFRPPKEYMNRFQEGWVAAITFQCNKGFNDDCDLSEPY